MSSEGRTEVANTPQSNPTTSAECIGENCDEFGHDPWDCPSLWDEAVPDGLIDDMQSELGRLLNVDGSDDAGVDWLNDIVACITPLIGRALIVAAETGHCRRDKTLSRPRYAQRLLSQGAVTREGTWMEKCIVCGLDRWASAITTGTPCLNCQRNEAGENDGY